MAAPQNPADYSDLKALFFNGTLKRSPETSNTGGLIEVSRLIMEKQGVSTRVIRTVDHDIASGVYPDMTEHGWPPMSGPTCTRLSKKRTSWWWPGPFGWATTPPRPRSSSSGCTPIPGELNGKGQWAFYPKVGGCLITGNEDGIKHCSMNVLYSLQHIGFTIPPQADAGWIGPVGPGPATWTKAPAARRATSPTATPRL